jgi:glutathione synthase/RimK-type ligase-like ATP-grasp enzyme
LKKIQKKLGNENFPLIQQTYYSSFSEMIITPDYPLVTKIGHSHAGFGKMLLERHDQFIDLSSVLALYNDYCTAERFIDSDYEIRIQKIGSDISAFKRTGFEWKRNTGGAMIEDIEVLPRYKTWINECGKMFGGLDIMSLDILVTKDNKEIILELNDTATGLAGKRPEDFQSVKKLIINKIQEISTK